MASKMPYDLFIIVDGHGSFHDYSGMTNRLGGNRSCLPITCYQQVAKLFTPTKFLPDILLSALHSETLPTFTSTSISLPTINRKRAHSTKTTPIKQHHKNGRHVDLIRKIHYSRTHRTPTAGCNGKPLLTPTRTNPARTLYQRLHHLVHPAVRISLPREGTRIAPLSVLFCGSKLPWRDGIADAGGTRRGTPLGLAKSGRHVVRLACD